MSKSVKLQVYFEPLPWVRHYIRGRLHSVKDDLNPHRVYSPSRLISLFLTYKGLLNIVRLKSHRPTKEMNKGCN